jgi:hypothetical protein
MTVFRFEEIDASLDLVPLAGRRALDAAGRKVGLEAWRGLPLEARRGIVAAGAAEHVDAATVRRLLGAAPGEAVRAPAEPPAGALPVELAETLAARGLTDARWSSLRALDRWALASLARRGRLEGLSALVAELAGADR